MIPLASFTSLSIVNALSQPSEVKAESISSNSSASISPGQLKAIKGAISKIIESDADKRGDGTSLTGTFVRLSWHCAGTYSKEDRSGGSNGGRIRFDPEASWGANAGLVKAREALEPVKVGDHI